jgi:hypothetical protein
MQACQRIPEIIVIVAEDGTTASAAIADGAFGPLHPQPRAPAAEHLVVTILRHLPLKLASQISARALCQMLQVTHGGSVQIFKMLSDLAIATIRAGMECIDGTSAKRGILSALAHQLVALGRWGPAHRTSPFRRRLSLMS